MARESTGASRALYPFSLLRWVILVTAGTFLGLLPPIAAYVAATRIDLPAWAVYPTVAMAGGLQGLLMGLGQALALYWTRAAVPRAGWTLITMAGALVAWSLGLLPATMRALDEPVDLDSRPVLWATVGGAVLLVLVVPLAHWLVLRRVMPGAGIWVVVESVAIVVALAAVWGFGQSVDPTRPLDDLLPQLALAGGAVALAFTLVTGLGMLMLAPRRGE